MRFFPSLLACTALLCQVHADLPECTKDVTSRYEQACRNAEQKANAQAVSAARKEAQKYLAANNFVAAKKLNDYADRLEKDPGSLSVGKDRGPSQTTSCAGSFMDGKQWKIHSDNKDYNVTAAGEDWGWREYKSKFVKGGGKDVLLLDSNWAIVWVSPSHAAHFELNPDNCRHGMVLSAIKGGKSKSDAAGGADKSPEQIIENIERKRCTSISQVQAELQKTYLASLHTLMMDCGHQSKVDDAAAIQEYLEHNKQSPAPADKKQEQGKDGSGFPKGIYDEHPGSFSFEFKGKSMLCKDRNNGDEMKTKLVRTSPNNEVFVFHRQTDNIDIAVFRANGRLYLIYTHESLERKGVEGLRLLNKR